MNITFGLTFRLIAIMLVFVCTSLAMIAQTSKSEENLRNFFDGYNTGNFALMKSTFAGPLKIFFTEKNLEQSFGAQFQQLGKSRITSTTWKNNHATTLLSYERDTTETISFGFAFSKKGKIIGLRGSNRPPMYSQKTHLTIQPQALTSIDSLLRLKQEMAGFSGCVKIINEGTSIYEQCPGNSNFATGDQLTPETLFDIASCSKAFTAMSIMLLQQQGKINVHDPITLIIPELKKYKGITIEHLLTHSSGIPDYMELFDKHWDKSKFATNDDVVQMMAKYHPKKSFSPGEEFEYSNTGYVLLALIVERVSKQPFELFMKNEIFDPLKMHKTRIYNTRRYKGEILPAYGYGHIYDFRSDTYTIPDSLPEYDYVKYLDAITGDGTVNTNILDLEKWDEALRNPGLFTQQSLDAAFTGYKLKNGMSTGYGYGWDIREKEGFETLLEHSGSWPGYTSYILRFKDVSRTIIILSNSEYLYVSSLAHKIAKMLE